MCGILSVKTGLSNMNRLTQEQSALLKRLESTVLRYGDLNDADKIICQFLIKLKYADATQTSRVDTGWGVTSFSTEYDIVTISETGKMYLINESLSANRELFLQTEMKSLRDIADSAKKAAKIAEDDSAQAKKDAVFSKVISIIAIIISIAAIIVPLVCGSH